VGRDHGSVTPDGACTSNIEGGLVFGGQVTMTCPPNAATVYLGADTDRPCPRRYICLSRHGFWSPPDTCRESPPHTTLRCLARLARNPTQADGGALDKACPWTRRA
jgi:hypothetical protein